ncbi:nuclear transport factor 2 family protein [Dongshaea marina]|uniref:nuclear transport factor 2 family protein n=1 Tax=Dongshaea marina TaxID=2047966 RepID=UPI000D3E2118|nr:nuclear transport factor 2 family protein [Dongshaea marina]
MDYKLRFKQTFEKVLGDVRFDEAVIRQHFAPDYHQWVDGKELDLDDFIQHMRALKASLESCEFEFRKLIVEGNELHSTHYVDAVKKDGGRVKAKVIGLFSFNPQGQLTSCDEMTYLIEGSEADRDLGSRT